MKEKSGRNMESRDFIKKQTEYLTFRMWSQAICLFLNKRMFFLFSLFLWYVYYVYDITFYRFLLWNWSVNKNRQNSFNELAWMFVFKFWRYIPVTILIVNIYTSTEFDLITELLAVCYPYYSYNFFFFFYDNVR